MTVNHIPSTGTTINPRLAEKIKDLSEERQWILLQQLLEGNVIASLHGLISKMSDDEQLTLLDRLQEKPINPVDTEETEITLRSHSRKSCMISTDYVVEGRNFEGFMLDISPAGAFIETGEGFTGGQQIQLAFSLPNHPGQLTITGEILWNGKFGIGLQFNELSRKQLDLIAAFMAEK
jgi:Tfp pilus assembly protein PilZ